MTPPPQSSEVSSLPNEKTILFISLGIIVIAFLSSFMMNPTTEYTGYTISTSYVRGDINGDLEIGGQDHQYLQAVITEGDYHPRADLNRDTVVNTQDLFILEKEILDPIIDAKTYGHDCTLNQIRCASGGEISTTSAGTITRGYKRTYFTCARDYVQELDEWKKVRQHCPAGTTCVVGRGPSGSDACVPLSPDQMS